MPIYALVICVARWLLQSFASNYDGDIKCEEDALAYLRTLIQLCESHSNASLVTIFGMLGLHRRRCFRPSCPCATLFIHGDIQESQRGSVAPNFTAYETGKMLPQRISGSWKLKALALLIGEVTPQMSKSYGLSLALAEISFYYFANYYQALCHVESVESKKPSFLCVQYTTNLRNVIETGMWARKDDAVALLSALKFQKKYNEFLTCIDDSCECTVKFWSVLLEDRPQCEALMQLGRQLYEMRYNFLQLVKEITSINSSYAEFLVKFGLYTRFILHDHASATNSYQRILWTCENINGSLLNAEDRFSVFRGDCQVMMLMVSLEQSSFFVVTEANNVVEHQLGYKREELLRFSANKLMPTHVAKQHHQFVQRFFQTMEAKTLRESSLKFLRHQEGHLVPCQVTKKILPTIGHGLQGMMLFYQDPGMIRNIQGKVDRTRFRVSGVC